MTRHAKAGRRHNKSDQTIINKWKKNASEMDADMTALGALLEEAVGNDEPEGEQPDDAPADDAPEPKLENSKAVNTLKAISKTADELRVGNYIVMFGGPGDLTPFEYIGNKRPAYRNSDGTLGDKFSKSVDLESGYTAIGRLPVDWEHGTEPETGKGVKAPGRDDVLGYVDWPTQKRDEKGVFVERVLNRRNKYVQWLEELIDAGLVGTSSECAPVGAEVKSTGEITKWPLYRDTLTVSPMEPRMMKANVLSAMKALGLNNNGQTAGQPEADTSPDASTTHVSTPNGEPSISEDTMPETIEELKAMISDTAKAVGELTTSVKAIAASKPVLPESNGVPENTKAVGEAAEVKAKGGPFKSLGEQLLAIKGVAQGADNAPELLNKLKAVKATGASEGSGPDGGFRIQSEFTNEVLDRVYNTGQVLSAVRKRAVGPGANGLTINTINETSRANGSRFGGVQAYWLNEGGTKTASKPTYRRFSLNLEKLIGLYYSTDELLQDDVALEGEVSDMFAKEINFRAEDAIFNGTGAGMPTGIIGASATVSVAKETGQAAATVVYQNIVKMWARLWAGSRPTSAWYINQDLEPTLDQMYLAAGTAGLEPRFITYGPDGVMRIKGRPVIPVEYAQTVGTVGDIVLADMEGYRWIDKGGVQSAASIHVAFTTDESTFRWVYRCNGAPFWASALTPKNGSNTLGQFVTLATRS